MDDFLVLADPQLPFDNHKYPNTSVLCLRMKMIYLNLSFTLVLQVVVQGVLLTIAAQKLL